MKTVLFAMILFVIGCGKNSVCPDYQIIEKDIIYTGKFEANYSAYFTWDIEILPCDYVLCWARKDSTTCWIVPIFEHADEFVRFRRSMNTVSFAGWDYKILAKKYIN